MKLRTALSRRSTAGVAVAALAATTVMVVGAQSASAESFAGQLVGHGVGSVFARTGSILTEGVAAGASATYTFQVINPVFAGNSPAQFKLKLNVGIGTQVLKSGSTVITQTAQSDGYYTNLLAPGKSQSFTMTVNMGTTPVQVEDDTTLLLQSLSGSTLQGITAVTYRKAPAKGSDVLDQFVKGAGGQLLGGPTDFQMASTTAVKPNGKATFTIQLQNDGNQNSDPYVSILDVVGSAADYPITSVKVGSTNITAQVLGAGWSSPTVIKPGGKMLLTVTVARVGPYLYGDMYEVDTFDALTSTSGGTQYLVVDAAA